MSRPLVNGRAIQLFRESLRKIFCIMRIVNPAYFFEIPVIDLNCAMNFYHGVFGFDFFWGGGGRVVEGAQRAFGTRPFKD